MNEYVPFIFPLILMLFVAVSFGEMVVSGLWLPAYFRYGVPLFRKEYPLPTMPDLAAKIPELEQKLKRSTWRPSIVFRALNENEIAFRHNFGSRNSLTGLIRLDPTQGRMRISGNLYWTFLLMPLLFLSLMLNDIWFMNMFFLIFLLAIFLVTFGRQRYQYGQIAAVIAETAVSAPPALTQTPELVEYAPKITEYAPQTTEFAPKTYEPVYYDPNAASPQTGLTTLEIVLIGVLAALIVLGLALGFLFFS